MSKRTKEYYIRSDNRFVSVMLKANSIKQAIVRFTNKHKSVLMGNWYFDIYTHPSMIDIVHTFTFDTDNTFIHQLKQHGINAVIQNDTGRNYRVVVPVSGGKDSQACYELALSKHGASNVLALFCDTDYEHTKTYKHVADITKDKPLVTLNAGTVEDMMLKHNRFPHGLSRFCTDELKIRPSKFFYKYFSLARGGFDV